MTFDLKIKNRNLSISSGSLEKVEGTDKLVQDVLKILLTPKGANKMNPWYGTFSSELIGSGLDEDVTMNLMKSQITDSLDTLKKLQDSMLKSNLTVTADELIHAITGISVFSDPTNMLSVNVIVEILSKGFKNIKTTYSIN